MKVLIHLPLSPSHAILATPALDNLLHGMSSAEMTLLCTEGSAELFRHNPRFARVEVVEKKARGLRLFNALAFGRKLALDYGPYEYGINLASTFSSSVLMKGAAKYVYGPRRGINALWLSKAVRLDKKAHMAVVYNQIATEALGSVYPTGGLSLHLSEKQKYPRPAAGIHPGLPQNHAGAWEPHKYAEAALRLSEKYHLVLFGGEAPEAARKVEEVLAFNGITDYTDLAGRTTPYMLMAAVAGLELLVTDDSAALHVAGAFDVPTVALFGPGDPERIGPWQHEKCVVLRKELPCSPCGKSRCRYGHRECMKGITGEMVLEAAETLEKSVS